VVDLRLLSVDGDLRIPIGEVHAQAMRMAVAGFDLARRNPHVEDADERILEGELVRIGRDTYRIERVPAGLPMGKACSDDEDCRGGKKQTFPGHNSLLVNGEPQRLAGKAREAAASDTAILIDRALGNVFVTSPAVSV
jgi:hypothetical protein